jgi:hyperosmotically inducible periplasmic protein
VIPGRLPAVVIGTLLLVVPVVVSACATRNISPGLDDDAAITARVKTALLNDQQIGVTKIDVTTVDGVVTISGPVKSKADEERAVQIAQRVAGVREVRSTLRIAD